jgi:hypothetical protein
VALQPLHIRHFYWFDNELFSTLIKTTAIHQQQHCENVTDPGFHKSIIQKQQQGNLRILQSLQEI